MQIPRQFRLTVLLLGLVTSAGIAQDTAEKEPEAPVVVDDEFDRGTPLRSVNGFSATIDRGDNEAAAEYLDLRNLRGEATELTGEQLARRLSVIIKRATWVDIDELVDHPEGRSNDGLPSYRDSIGVVLDEGNQLRLLMQKVPRGDGVLIWKVSNATVSMIPELYEEYGYPEIVEDVRRNLPNAVFLGYELFKWAIVLLVAVTTYVLVLLLALTIRRLFGDQGDVSRQRIFRFRYTAAPFLARVIPVPWTQTICRGFRRRLFTAKNHDLYNSRTAG